MTRTFRDLSSVSLSQRFSCFCAAFPGATTLYANPTSAAGKRSRYDIAGYVRRNFAKVAVVLGVCLVNPLAVASGPWTASLVFQGSNGPVWQYAPTTYPNKQQAIAAMQALGYGGSGPGLTQESFYGMGTSTVTYAYVAPTVPMTFSAWTYRCGSSDCSPTLSATTEASLVSAVIAQLQTQPPPPSCPRTINGTAPSGGWTQYQSSTPAGPYDTVDQRGYSYTLVTATNPPQCSPPQNFNGNFGITRDRTASCPRGLVYDYSNGTCHGYVSGEKGFVTGPFNACAAGGGPSTQVGDHCDVLTGDFSQTETDYSAAGLSFTRYYHSVTLESSHNLGVGWTHNWAGSLVLSSGVPAGLVRPDSHHDAIQSINGAYISLSGAGIHIQQSGSNWIAYMGDGSQEIYNGAGQLMQKVTSAGLVTTLTYNATTGLLTAVADPFGHTVQFSYNANNFISTITEPDGTSTIVYAYDGNNNLVSVTYPDQSVRQYKYQDSNLPNSLTQIIDESNNVFLTVGYNDTTGAVTSSQQAGGAQSVSIVYQTNAALVTDPLGATNTYTFTSAGGYSPRVTSLVRNNLTQTFTVPPPSTDPQQRVTQVTDANGNITTYSYDTDHLTSKTEAYGTPRARTTSYQYLATNTALPKLVTESLRKTAYAYYPNTNLVQTKTVTDLGTNVTRTWTYTYDSYGRMLTLKGPRTDVNSTTTYAYYTCTVGVQCGQVQTVTDALGHVTTYTTYNTHGQPLTITDPNGVVTTLIYDARQRMTSRNVGGETTNFSYWPTGLIEQVTLPDNSSMLYSYDGAHRLTQISDGLGNKVVYTLDAMGNRTAENAYDPSNVLHHTHTRVINSLNQVYQEINAAGTAAVTTTFGYDNNGNQTTVSAPLSRNTTNAYDELNRPKQITDPANGVTKLGYDAEDNLTSVIDPRNLTTSYTYNGFGDVVTQTSPDTGTTTNSYDSGGNLATSTDARGAVATHTYDALNRVTSVAYSNAGVTDQTISYSYDAGAYGKGRMTGASDANQSMTWAYDALGRVISKSQTVGGFTKTVAYAYTNGDLTSLTTPSGLTIAYGYNTNHQATSISMNGTTVLSAVTYEPFGAVSGWTWGNGTTTNRSYDTDEKITQISSAGVKSFTYDNAFRITGITDTSTGSSNWTYGYDLLDRMTSATSPSVTRGWTYDGNGNRLTETGSAPSTYTISPTSNQITGISGALARTYSYDASGNTLGFSTATATYNGRGRMQTQTAQSTQTYIYNALGQLIATQQAPGGLASMYVYDESGHTLGSYNRMQNGSRLEETVWLGDIPVATTQFGSTVSVAYIHTDHLNTPRQVTRPSDNAQQWTWFSDPFGTQRTFLPFGSVAGTELRFPGQIAYWGGIQLQQLATQYYNYFRNYDSFTGRYLESDPIGLQGGYNTYAYVGDNPLSGADPFGLQAPGFTPLPRPPRQQLCLLWTCKVCEDIPTCLGVYHKCTEFFVNAPFNQPGQGGFFGNGGYAGDASKMPECFCVKSVPAPP
jgi:RHS repeat-associated protein